MTSTLASTRRAAKSFERQRQAVQTLTAERLEAAVDREARQAAAVAFDDHAHPIARYLFVIERGAW